MEAIILKNEKDLPVNIDELRADRDRSGRIYLSGNIQIDGKDHTGQFSLNDPIFAENGITIGVK